MAYQQVPGGYMVTPEDGSAPFMIPDSAAQQMGLAGPPGPVDVPSQFQIPGETMVPAAPYVPPENPGQAPTLGGGQLAPLDAAPAAGSVIPTDVAAPDLKIEDQFIPGTPHETSLSPRGTYQLGTGLGIQGLGELSQGQAEEAKAAGRGYDKLAAYNETAAKEAGTAADERFRREQESANFIAMDIAEVKKAGSNLDAGRWYGSRSTGQKFAIFIGAALAGVLSPRGENSMVKLVGRQIDQDVQVQMAQLQNKQWAVGQRQNMLQFMMARGANEETARAAAKVYLGQSYMQQMQAEMARTKAPQAIAAGKVAMAGMLQDHGEWTRSLERLLAEQEIKRQALTMRGSGGGGGKGGGEEGPANGAMLDPRTVYLKQSDGTDRVTFPDDADGKKKAGEFRDLVVASQQLVDATDNILRMDLSTDWVSWDPKRMEAERYAATIMMAEMQKIKGVATEQDMQTAATAFNNAKSPTEMWSALKDYRAAFEAYKSKTLRDMDTTLQTYGPGADGKARAWVPSGAHGRGNPTGEENKKDAPPTPGEHQRILKSKPNEQDTPESFHDRQVESIKATGTYAVKRERTRANAVEAGIGGSGLAPMGRGEIDPRVALESKEAEVMQEMNAINSRRTGANFAKREEGKLSPEDAKLYELRKVELAEIRRQKSLIKSANNKASK